MRSNLARQFGALLNLMDKLILVAVAAGTIAIAFSLLADLAMDVVRDEQHGLVHLLGELMFVLIVMELFRQVVSQLRKQAFSLKPILAIGVLASIRGLLILQMKLGNREIDWVEGSLGVLGFALAALSLLCAHYLYLRIRALDFAQNLPH